MRWSPCLSTSRPLSLSLSLCSALHLLAVFSQFFKAVGGCVRYSLTGAGLYLTHHTAQIPDPPPHRSGCGYFQQVLSYYYDTTQCDFMRIISAVIPTQGMKPPRPRC
jgi:hypothetical protein